MRLQKFVLHNFSAYAGRQELDLSVTPEKPIILVGALNGSGKTTLLDAMKLVLYGKRAKCSTRGQLAYDDYLRACIHRKVRPSDGASLDLTFTYFEQGQEHAIRVIRLWKSTGTGIREELDVLHDGHRDALMAEHWADKVEEFLPQSLSGLFLFDGEKIEELADPTQSQELIRNAIDGLLGADVVNQLVLDLQIVHDKQMKSGASTGDQADFKAAENDVEAARRTYEAATNKALATESDLQNLRQQFSEIEEKISVRGGKLYERREAMRSRRDQLARDLHSIDDQLRALASSALPFAIVADQLAAALSQAEAEAEAKRAKAALGEIAQRDAALLTRFSERLSGGGGRELAQWLDQDRAIRAQKAAVPIILDMSDDALSQLRATLKTTIPQEQARAADLLRRREELEEEALRLDRELVAVPDSETMRGLLNQRHELEEGVNTYADRLLVLQGQVAHTARQLQVCTARLEKLREKIINNIIDHEDAARVAAYARRSQATLRAFRDALVSSQVERLSSLVMESFRELMRKRSIIGRLAIDPVTCALTLHTEDGDLVPAERLSAGERQVLAVALLWGLARASGRPLPTIIDTPMARLDSKHRAKLVDHYFPRASHQVLILSTDEEIDDKWYPRILPHVARAYTLAHDDVLGATTIRPGYMLEAARG
jgi:DNA sulfur modification protein DndD